MNGNCKETYRVKKNSVIKLGFFSYSGKLFLWARFVTDASKKDYFADIKSLSIVYLIQTYPFLRRETKPWLGE